MPRRSRTTFRARALASPNSRLLFVSRGGRARNSRGRAKTATRVFTRDAEIKRVTRRPGSQPRRFISRASDQSPFDGYKSEEYLVTPCSMQPRRTRESILLSRLLSRARYPSFMSVRRRNRLRTQRRTHDFVLPSLCYRTRASDVALPI